MHVSNLRVPCACVYGGGYGDGGGDVCVCVLTIDDKSYNQIIIISHSFAEGNVYRIIWNKIFGNFHLCQARDLPTCMVGMY